MSARIVASWARVSSDEQSERGSSLPEQVEENAATITRLGLKGRVHIYCNTDESALGEKPRPHFERLLADVSSGKVAVVVAKHWQRLARNSLDFLKLWEAVKLADTALYVGGALVNLRDSASRLGALVQVEGSSIDTKVRLDASAKGRIRLAALGFASSGGFPFGRFIPATLAGTHRVWAKKPNGEAAWEFDRDAKKYVQRAARLYLSGMSWPEVAEQVVWPDDKPTTADKRGNILRRRVLEAGGMWEQRFKLRDNLPQSFAGVEHADRIRFEGKEAIVTVPVPALLDDDTLARVRAKAGEKYLHRKQGKRYALNGFLRCGVCGSALNVRNHVEGGKTVVRVAHKSETMKPGCASSFLRYEPIEFIVLAALGDLLRDEKAVTLAVHQALAAKVPEADTLKDEIAALRQQRAKDERTLQAARRNRLLTADLDAEEAALMDLEIAGLKERMQKADAQIDAAEQRIAQARMQPDQEVAIAAMMKHIRMGVSLLAAPVERQREAMRAMFGTTTLRNRPSNAKAGSPATGIFLTRRTVQDLGGITRDPKSGKLRGTPVGVPHEVIEWKAVGRFFIVDGQVSADPAAPVVTTWNPGGGDLSGITGALGGSYPSQQRGRRWSGSACRGTGARAGPGGAGHRGTAPRTPPAPGRRARARGSP